MPNLFPTSNSGSSPTSETSANRVKFGRSWRFDFDAGEFVLTPSGRVAEASDADAWLVWCNKAVRTERYRYMVYSRRMGQEFEDLIARHLTRPANELEIIRITTETLKTDLRTASVGNFTFDWQGDQCFFSCQVTNVRGQSGTVNGVMGNG
jgi:hypothetical protein